MKRFMKGVLEWKTGASLAFTGSVLVYLVISLLMGERQIEATAIIAMLLLSTTGTFVQYLCFTDNIIRNMRYTRRLMLFGALFMPLLTGIAGEPLCMGAVPGHRGRRVRGDDAGL